MDNVTLIIVIIAVAILAIIVIPQWRLKRAIPQVVRIFREASATSEKSARTLDELGLKPRGMMENMLRGRDYRQYAVTALMRSEIVKATEEGKLYLSEERLYETGLERKLPYVG